MKYTPEQYKNMVEYISSSMLMCEIKNSRVLKNLEDEQELITMHEELEKKILECIHLISDIEEKLP